MIECYGLLFLFGKKRFDLIKRNKAVISIVKAIDLVNPLLSPVKIIGEKVT